MQRGAAHLDKAGGRDDVQVLHADGLHQRLPATLHLHLHRLAHSVVQQRLHREKVGDDRAAEAHLQQSAREGTVSSAA